MSIKKSKKSQGETMAAKTEKTTAILTEKRENVFSPPPVKKLKQACLSFGQPVKKSPDDEPSSKRNSDVKLSMFVKTYERKRLKTSNVTTNLDSSDVLDKLPDTGNLSSSDDSSNKSTHVNHLKDTQNGKEKLDSDNSNSVEMIVIASSKDAEQIQTSLADEKKKEVNATVSSDSEMEIEEVSLVDDTGLVDAKSSDENCTAESSFTETKNNESDDDKLDDTLNASALISLSSSDENEETFEDLCDDDADNVCVADNNSQQPASKHELPVTSSSAEIKNSTNVPKPSIKRNSKKSIAKKKEKEVLREQLRLEKLKKIAERERQKLEKEQQKAEKQKERQQKLQAKEEALAQKKKEKADAEALRKLKQEIKEREKEQKEENKKKKHELLEARNEEKRKKDFEKSLKEEEAARKKEKLKAAFVNFFVKKDSSDDLPEFVTGGSLFKPFQIREKMTLAPTHRVQVSDCIRNNLIEQMKLQNKTELFLVELTSGIHIPRKTCRTKTTSCDDVQIVEENSEITKVDVKTPHAKLLQFSDNARPPYWGTWTKKSKNLNPRNPFAKDEKLFDYEVDSDDEWEEEEPGISLSGTEDEKESEDDYDIDNEFMVPHGYLSDGENNEEEPLSPETQKAKLKMKIREFEEERKSKCHLLKPQAFGCLWINELNHAYEALKSVLEQYQAVAMTSLPIQIKIGDNTTDSEALTDNQCKPKFVKKILVPEEAFPFLIKLVHGNRYKLSFLAEEFSAFWKVHVTKEHPECDLGAQDKLMKCDTTSLKNPVDNVESAVDDNKQCVLLGSENSALNNQDIDKITSPAFTRQVIKIIRSISKRDKLPETKHKKKGVYWIVLPEILAKYNLSDLSLENAWNYITIPPSRKCKKTVSPADATSTTVTTSTSPKSVENINKDVNANTSPVSSVPRSTPKARMSITKFFTTPPQTTSKGKCENNLKLPDSPVQVEKQSDVGMAIVESSGNSLAKENGSNILKTTNCASDMMDVIEIEDSN